MCRNPPSRYAPTEVCPVRDDRPCLVFGARQMRYSSELPADSPPPSSIIIENVTPSVDGGRHPVKREIGDTLVVSADIYKDGHDKIAALLKVRSAGVADWTEIEMAPLVNDRWQGEVELPQIGRWEYTIEAFPDLYATWLDELTKKVQAGIAVPLELIEGRLLVESVIPGAGADIPLLQSLVHDMEAARLDQSVLYSLFTSDVVVSLMRRHRSRAGAATLDQPLPLHVDRVKARYAAWYEVFPRSAGTVPGVSGTFDDVIQLLPYVQSMGFDVLYFPPIHPIGHTNRKGPNNTLVAGPTDPGSPYAIGNEHGGHDAIEPSLGTFGDFARLVAAAAEHGLEIALDFAINCSPDHPWVKAHPEWFHIRPDGSIKYSENPPKKYEDIYPINFNSSDWQGLWAELKRVFLFWIERGVKIFRVDNPHTKPTVFWGWVIDEVQRDHPDVIFLSEAFTRPKVMKGLAKAGFTQSYSYFTWRNYKEEIIEYFTELTQTDVADYMRANLFVNTPDILPFIIQTGGRPACKMRLVLAATLSSVYGLYSGYELCENSPVPGKEEYLNSEKYELKVWDWDRPGNIIEYVTLINRIRREHASLHEYDNLRFYPTDDANFVCYGKTTPEKDDGILVVVNLDPFQPHETLFHMNLADFGIEPGEQFMVTELITGQNFIWDGATHHVYLDPTWEPALIYAIKRAPDVDFVPVCG